MDNELEILERQVTSQPPGTVPAAEVMKLLTYHWGQAMACTEQREKPGRYKRAAFFAHAAFESGERSPAALETMARALQAACRVHSFPGPMQKALMLVQQARVAPLGATLKPVQSLRGRVEVASGLLAFFDSESRPRLPDLEPRTLLNAMREGKLLAVALGSHDIFAIELRAIHAPVPAIGPDEFSKMTSTSPTYGLKVPSGTLGCADGSMLLVPGRDSGLAVNIKAGPAQLCVYRKPGKGTNIVAVVCPAAAEAPVEADRIELLE
jgi:hypothetical protein